MPAPRPASRLVSSSCLRARGACSSCLLTRAEPAMRAPSSAPRCSTPFHLERMGAVGGREEGPASWFSQGSPSSARVWHAAACCCQLQLLREGAKAAAGMGHPPWQRAGA